MGTTMQTPFMPMEGAWDDEDQELMEMLLLATPEVTETLPHAVETLEKVQERRQARTATIDAPTKSKPKAKLSATEKKARHREVVRRSYHRTKEATKVLQDEVKALEDKFRSLTAARSESATNQSGVKANEDEDMEKELTMTRPIDSALDRIDALKEQCATLDATSEQLRKEAVKLQGVLLRHQEFARVVQEAFDEELEESNSEEEHESIVSSAPSSPSTATTSAMNSSEDDFSPVKATFKRALYAIPKPTYVEDSFQPPAIARTARKEVGFSPLTPLDAKRLSSEIVNDIVGFSLNGRAVSTGASVLGWQDRRVIDKTTVRFSLRKPFAGHSCFDLMAKTWQCFSDPGCAHEKFRGLMELRILQRVSDDNIIALRDTLSVDGEKVFRFVYMLFRMRTSRGFLIGVKSIDDPQFLDEKQKRRLTRDGKEIHWVDMSGWFLFDRQGYLEPNSVFVETGSEVEYGGNMDFGDASQAVTLAMNTLSTVLKWETLMVAPLFALPPSSE